MNQIKCKWIGKFILLGIVGFVWCSCNAYLNESPDNRTELDSESKISQTLLGAYPTTYYALLAELSSDNTDDNGDTYSTLNLLQQQVATWTDVTEKGSDSTYNLWNSCYLAIAVANEALQAIEKLGNPSSLNAQRGEALLCRAYAHFILANIFCKAYSSQTGTLDLGIPYITQPETTVSPHYERGTVEDDYRSMAQDIEMGLPLINDKSYTIPKYHFNKKAAYAFAARFYLYYTHDDKTNYAKVVEYAGHVLSEDASSTLRNWSAVGALSPNTQIRAKAFVDADDKANLMLLSAYSIWPRIYGPYSVGSRYTHNGMIAEFETNQCESTLWGDESQLYFKVYRYEAFPKVVMDKIPEYFEYTDAVNGIGYAHAVFSAFTTDECLLNRAEAYALTGKYTEAVADINCFVHAFAKVNSAIDLSTIISVYGDFDESTGKGMKYYKAQEPTPKKALHPDFSVTQGTQESIIQAILYLRRVLCLHDGLRWFDIKRYGIEINRRLTVNGKISVYDILKEKDERRALQLPAIVVEAGMQPNPRP